MSRLKLQSEATVPTDFGNFRFLSYAKSNSDMMPHLAIVSPLLDTAKPVLLRIHSECMTGDVFASKKCDCGQQLHASLKAVSDQAGVVVYLRQEGRGIGLIEKLKAYKLQENGMDTVDANLALGHQADSRDYSDAVAILKDLGISKVRVLTNNPDKIEYLKSSDVEVVSREAIILPTKSENESYFETKKNRMGHLL